MVDPQVEGAMAGAQGVAAPVKEEPSEAGTAAGAPVRKVLKSVAAFGARVARCGGASGRRACCNGSGLLLITAWPGGLQKRFVPVNPARRKVKDEAEQGEAAAGAGGVATGQFQDLIRQVANHAPCRPILLRGLDSIRGLPTA